MMPLANLWDAWTPTLENSCFLNHFSDKSFLCLVLWCVELRKPRVARRSLKCLSSNKCPYPGHSLSCGFGHLITLTCVPPQQIQNCEITQCSLKKIWGRVLFGIWISKFNPQDAQFRSNIIEFPFPSLSGLVVCHSSKPNVSVKGFTNHILMSLSR